MVGLSPAMVAMFVSLFPCLCLPLIGGVGLVLTVFWIWMLVEVLTKEPSAGNDKVVWLLVVILLHGVGALVYFLVRRPERIRQFGQ